MNSSADRLSIGASGRSLRIALLSSISMAALSAGSSVWTPAFAQTDTSSASSGGIEEVIVTARKKSENIQNVPLSIKALTAEDLQAAGVQDLRDITFQTPGLTFNEGAGAGYFSKPIIRGQTDLSSNPDNNVPVFFDGVYISNTSSIDFGLIDLARVEVIKGPVSATYGRSAYAGAINYVSAPPGDEVGGYVEATAGDYDKFNIRGSVSGPITDTLKGGISGSYDTFNGTYHDSSTGENANGYTKRDGLINLDWTPTSNLEIRPVVYYGNDRFDPAATLFGPANCSVGLGYGFSQSYCGKVPGGAAEGWTTKPEIADDGRYGATGNRRQVLLANLQIKLSFDWGTFTSLTGYGHYITREYDEFDDAYGITAQTYNLPAGAQVGQFGVPGTATGNSVTLPLLFGYTNDNIDVSQELRYSSPQNLPYRFSVGGYYASTDIYQDLQLAQETCAVPAGQYVGNQGFVDVFASPCGQNFSNQKSNYTLSNRIFAGFASADWDILDNLTLSTELRETEEKASYTDLFAIFTPNPYGTFPLTGYSTTPASTPCPIGTTPSGACTTFNKDFWSLTSRTSLTYKPTEGVTLYVSAANGDKSGGFNNSTINPAYGPEKNWTYEAGIKTNLLDDHLQLDGDIFYIHADNYQIYGPPPGATLPGGFVTTNYGGLSTKGGEISADYVVNDFASLEAGLAYADPKFRNDAFDFGDKTLCSGIPSCAGRITTVGPNSAVSLNGLTPPYVSKFTFNTALSLRYPVGGDWFLNGRVDYRYESKQFYQYPIDTGYFGPRNNLNLRAGVENDVWSLTGFVRNLTNDKTPITAQDASATGAENFQAGYFPVVVLPDGRSFGATVRYKF